MRLKSAIAILTLMCSFLLSSCGNSEDATLNKYTNVNEAMEKSMISVTTPSDDVIETDSLNDDSDNSQTNTINQGQTVVSTTTTSVTTTSPSAETSVQTETQTQMQTQASTQTVATTQITTQQTENTTTFTAVLPTDYLQYSLPDGWSQQLNNTELLLISSDQSNCIMVDVFNVEGNVTDEEAYNSFLSQLSSTFSFSDIQQYGSWYITETTINNVTYEFLFLKSDNLMISLFVTSTLDTTTFDSFLTSLTRIA